MTYVWYDRQGNPIPFEEWRDLYKDRGYCSIAHTVVRAGDQELRVSTVWEGQNYALGMDGPPVTFETKTFDGDGNEIERGRWLYSTEADARVGHEGAVSQAQGRLISTGVRFADVELIDIPPVTGEEGEENEVYPWSGHGHLYHS